MMCLFDFMTTEEKIAEPENRIKQLEKVSHSPITYTVCPRCKCLVRIEDYRSHYGYRCNAHTE